MTARLKSGAAASSAAAPAVSKASSTASPRALRKARHCFSAIGWLATTRNFSSTAPGAPINCIRMGQECSETMRSPEPGRRAATSGTGPAMLFSTGTKARSQAPARAASNTSPKVAKGTGWTSGRWWRQASWLKAP